MDTKYKEYYEQQLEEAQEFQDYCANLFLREIGITITNYQSKKYQYSEGENLQGLEIKFDKKYGETGNLYIETHEKSNPDNPNYVKSGIYRLDNTWLYCIGDYSCVWIFSKRLLILLHESGKYREVKTPTSVAFLLKIKEANKYCAKKIQKEL